MKNIVSILIIFILGPCCAQELGVIDFQCSRTKNTPSAALVGQFPFSQVSVVELVSFKNIFSTTILEDGTSVNVLKDRLPRKNGKVDYQEIIERTSLTNKQIDQLVDILYNFSRRDKSGVLDLPGCYDPRNAVVFLDTEGDITEVLEICFSCMGYDTDHQTDFGDFCEGKYDMLKDFFIQNGISYGTQKF